ncbi:MAG: hypothetical protein KA163_10885 [Bacteroidia bacterium]|nr:hypothetical protein [Bacteroidia bacterium]
MKNICILVTFILLSSCAKKDRDDGLGSDACNIPINTPISSTDLLKADFKTGSYWIFLDSISLTYDSAIVIQESNDYQHTSGFCENQKNQIITYKIKYFPSLVIEDYRIGGDLAGITKTPYTTVYIEFNQPQTPSSQYSFVYYDSLFIYDRYYYRVEKSTITQDVTENNNTVIYYMNSDLGFLRKDIINTSSAVISKKFLIRKNIIK